MMTRKPLRLAVQTAIAVLLAGAAAAQPTGVDRLRAPWPDRAAVDGIEGQAVSFPTGDPFTLADVGQEESEVGIREAQAELFLPPAEGHDDGGRADAAARAGTHREGPTAAPWPAVVLVHGAGGVSRARELTYARQFAAMGVAALVVDAFGARRDLATGFTERLLNVTETMLLADAYAGLHYLAARQDIDGDRIALIGFSYGAMASVFGAYAQVAETLAPGDGEGPGPRFAAHVAFYGPCIARFAEPRTTGAPVLMMAGTEDAIVDIGRCEQIAADLREGGSRVETLWFEGAWHQWDGAFAGPRPIGRNLARCRLRVDEDGGVADLRTGLPMTGPVTRRLILGLCVEDAGYLIGRDDGVRARSNAAMGRFLAAAL